MNTLVDTPELIGLIRLANILGYRTYRYSDGRINLMNASDIFGRDILFRATESELTNYLINKLDTSEDILNYLLECGSEDYLNNIFFAIREQDWFNDPLVEKIKELDGNSQMLIMSRIANHYNN